MYKHIAIQNDIYHNFIDYTNLSIEYGIKDYGALWQISEYRNKL